MKHMKRDFFQTQVSHPLGGLGVGSKGKNSTFSEDGHVA